MDDLLKIDENADNSRKMYLDKISKLLDAYMDLLNKLINTNLINLNLG